MQDFDFSELKTNGIKINYLYVCERKLWLFDRGIQRESDSDKVLIGKLTSKYSYPREKKKELLIDNLISIDIVGSDYIVEVKHSNKLSQADKIQILYYLYFLKKFGVEKKGIINYPKLRKKEVVELNEEEEREVEKALLKVKEILSLEEPPEVKRKKYCPKCAYYLFCFVDQ